MFQNFKTVEISPGFPVARHHRCEDWGNIYFIYILIELQTHVCLMSWFHKYSCFIAGCVLKTCVIRRI